MGRKQPKGTEGPDSKISDKGLTRTAREQYLMGGSIMVTTWNFSTGRNQEGREVNLVGGLKTGKQKKTKIP